MSTQEQKNENLEKAVVTIRKKYGTGSIVQGDDVVRDVDVIPTGALSLDRALGVGGIPRGRITEIYGAEGCGKTTLALHIVANAQQAGGNAAFIDVEHALDPGYAGEGIGVDIDNLILAQPDYGEQAIDIVLMLLENEALDIIVIDSVAALIPKAELDADIEAHRIASTAILMSKSLRKIAVLAHKANTAVVFINQLRTKPGVMFGNPEDTPGGRSLKYYASVRIDLKRSTSIDEDSQKMGHKMKATVQKNKVARPFKKAEYDLFYGTGIDKTGCIFDIGIEQNIISQRGSWFSIGDTRLGMGRQNAISFLKDNKDLLDRLEQQIKTGLPDGKNETEIQNQ